MNWNDTIRIGDVDKIIVPEAGMIVQKPDGTWVLFFPTAEWVHKDGFRDLVPRLLPFQESYIPILPAVTPGCGYAREQALELLQPYKYGDDRAFRLCEWDVKAVIRAGVGIDFADCHLYWENEHIPELKLAIQRYEVLVAWWEQSNG
jgi:hypothetical protein